MKNSNQLFHRGENELIKTIAKKCNKSALMFEIQAFRPQLEVALHNVIYHLINFKSNSRKESKFCFLDEKYTVFLRQSVHFSPLAYFSSFYQQMCSATHRTYLSRKQKSNRVVKERKLYPFRNIHFIQLTQVHEVIDKLS